MELNSIVIDSSTILGIIAILISFFGLYYTRKQLLMPLIMETQKAHMFDLKNYLSEWQNDLSLHKSSYDFVRSWVIDIGFFYSISRRSIWPFWPETESQSRISISKLEADWRYNDLIESHLPGECQDLKDIWETYKNLINKHEEQFYHLFEKLEKDTLNELNKLEIEYKNEVNWKQDKRCFILVGGIIQSLLLQYIFYYMPKEKQYDGKLAYSKGLVYTTSNCLIVRIYNHPTHLAEGSEIDLQKIKNLFEIMAFSNAWISKYKEEIIELMELEKSLSNNCNEIHRVINKLQGYLAFPNKKCKLLKVANS